MRLLCQIVSAAILALMMVANLRGCVVHLSRSERHTQACAFLLVFALALFLWGAGTWS